MTKTSDAHDSTAECPDPEDLVAFVLDREEAADAEGIRQHMAGCARCRGIAAEVEGTVGRLRRPADAPAARDLVPGVLAGIPTHVWAAPRGRVSGESRPVLLAWMPVRLAAVALVAAACAFLLVFRAGDGRPADTPAATARGGAVSKGIDWLIARQTSSGGWNVAELGGRPDYAPALNGLAVLALTRSNAEASTLTNALSRAGEFLLGRQAESGRFGRDFDGTLYNHGIATLALLETYCVTRDDALRAPITKALAFIRERQSSAGGWGYRDTPASQPNTSLTAWQVQALLLADRLGWKGNRLPVRKALAWMSGTVNETGFFGYERVEHFPEGPGTLTMMGAYCLLAAQHMEIPVDPALMARVVRGVGKLAGDRPDDYYGTFFYASALTEADPAGYRDALASARSSLITRQEMAGLERGAWRPDDHWGKAGGRLYSTTMALLALSPPHEHLPPM